MAVGSLGLEPNPKAMVPPFCMAASRERKFSVAPMPEQGLMAVPSCQVTPMRLKNGSRSQVRSLPLRCPEGIQIRLGL